MNYPLLIAAMTFAAACGAPCRAQPTAPNVGAAPLASAVPAAPATAADRSEPDVKHTVIEDDGARIDELRVRGQTQRITVTPKLPGTRAYEIITGDAGRDTFDGTGGARSAVGKRVWSVLSF